MNVLTTKEIECTCLQSNCNNTYLVKFLRPYVLPTFFKKKPKCL